VHDYFNLAALPPIIALCLLSILAPGSSTVWGLGLAWFMAAYVVVDSAWILASPTIVRAPLVLLAHHAATVLLLAHALTHPAHLRYVAELSLVEANTFFLIARRHYNGRLRPLLDAAFHTSWIAIRTLWFPSVAVRLVLLPAHAWPAAYRRLLVCAAACALALLQLVWTRDAFKALLEKRRKDAPTSLAGAAVEGWL